jgi:hypothetical protein
LAAARVRAAIGLCGGSPPTSDNAGVGPTSELWLFGLCWKRPLPKAGCGKLSAA